MERYDSIEYSSEISNPDIQVSSTDGFITSQHHTTEESAQKYEREAESEPKPPKKRRESPSETVVIAQLAVCIIIAAAAFVIKNMGGEIYEKTREFYYDCLNDTIVVDFERNSNDRAVKDIQNDIFGK